MDIAGGAHAPARRVRSGGRAPPWRPVAYTRSFETGGRYTHVLPFTRTFDETADGTWEIVEETLLIQYADADGFATTNFYQFSVSENTLLLTDSRGVEIWDRTESAGN